ncbi:hypothetical protein FHS83_002264 [Rhizomicrobium palustre]|uniref:Uncharacterized protein n=1 Tax=Rhizomicrobium palustre TaxID=189966 RepID=A0A846MZU0_9PROT|nr:hypothetical protein [Rhizomicrobium palustre]
MTKLLRGSLVADGGPDFSGYRVSAAYDRKAEDELFLPVLQSANADAAGNWQIALEFDPIAEVRLTVRTAAGVAAGSLATQDLDAAQAIKLTDIAQPVVIPPNQDPTLGRSTTLTGRALQPDGSGIPQGLPVVLWAKPDGAQAIPVLVTGTGEGGYFSGDWPASLYAEAWGTVAGSKPIPIGLVSNRFPLVVLLVVSEVVKAPAPAKEDDCDCHTPAPPRTPDAADFVANPEAFSEDLGSECVNLTMPNRTLEEVVFHALVRTTEPEIKGTTLASKPPLPKPLANRFAALATVAAPKAANTRMDAAAGTQALSLDRAVASDLLNDGHLGSVLGTKDLKLVNRLSEVARTRDIIGIFRPYLMPGRVELDRNHVVDWDDDLTVHQATSIAIGHLLTLKQVWRADGYSLGDLLYSLPLAPGQKKQIAIVDWERRDETVRQSSRSEFEQLAADLSHDRDISAIINTSLSEHARGSSSASVSAVGGGIGGFIGPVVFGGGGGHSSASSTAHSHNWRDVAGSTLNQARDRTQQAASVIRGQRATTIQTTTQGESLRAQTEVVANHNHCHAMSMEYFEVLRHFKVSTELADVQECLFIPFEITAFTANKALRWRDPLAKNLSRKDLLGGFDALARIHSSWADADLPAARYADDIITYLDGALTISFSLPRPADDGDNHYVAGNWSPWTALFSSSTTDIWNNYLGNVLPEQRDTVWNERLAPLAAEKLVNSLTLQVRLDDGTYVPIPLDATLVSRFRQDEILEVSLQPEWTSPSIQRSRIQAVTLSLGITAPYTTKVVARTGSLYYRTDHLDHYLFVDYLIDDELSAGPPTEIGVHLDRLEKRNPRKEDVLLGARLVAHLNERLEFYHEGIFRSFHDNRLYLLLDGVIAPNSGGRSVASVVENRLIGIVGNCLVMPVVPGLHLDPGYKTDPRRKTTLLDLYAADAPPPVRISVPTKGVFAEAVNGACNSCEKKDDTRFWRWEESPIPDEPMPISAVGTGGRAGTPPNLRPDDFPNPIIGYQQVPTSQDPTGLAAALTLIGTPNLFRDLTGLDLNQQASAAAFSKALDTAQFFGTQAANLAQQRYANREMDRNLERINKAVDDKLITPEQGQDLTEKVIASGTGKGAANKPAPSATPAVKKAIERASSSESGSVKVSRASGSVEITTGTGGAIDFDVTPLPPSVKQPTPNTCWAAGGTMLMAWKKGAALTVETAMDAAGGSWRSNLDADHALTVNEVKSFAKAIDMSGESPMCYLPSGLLRLLKAHGPLWVIGDDAVENNKMAHVRVVVGMHGDGTSDGTQVKYVDPADGLIHNESYSEFAKHLEASDASSLNLGIYHY